MTNPISHFLQRWSVRRRQFDGRPETLDALYATPDPWGLGRHEHPRFEATNALIASNCPQLGSILEIGCGEGYQTRYFRGLADEVTGIDISATAVSRARIAVPRVNFVVGTLPDVRAALPLARYDLVTLCEVLVYGDDPATLLGHAQSLADQLFVSSFAPQCGKIEHLCRGPGWQELAGIELGRKRWRTFLWSRAAAVRH